MEFEVQKYWIPSLALDVAHLNNSVLTEDLLHIYVTFDSTLHKVNLDFDTPNGLSLPKN